MQWTTEQPTKPGWYWMRDTGPRRVRMGEQRRIVYVRNYVGALCIDNWQIPDSDTEWAGPLPEPEEDIPYGVKLPDYNEDRGER